MILAKVLATAKTCVAVYTKVLSLATSFFSMNKFMSAREAGDAWGVSGVTVARWCAEGRVPGATQIKVSWLIPSNLKLSDVERPKMGRPESEDEKSPKNA